MLSIRMQRTGRKGHAQFRLIIQESKFQPTSGRIIAQVGTYDPHTKKTVMDKETVEKYLSTGAQPSPRLAMLITQQGIALPKWYKAPSKQVSVIRNSDKLRRNQPKEEVVVEAPVAEVEVAEPVVAA
jgi:small subunit ribosomal protein S16